MEVMMFTSQCGGEIEFMSKALDTYRKYIKNIICLIRLDTIDSK